LLGKPLAEPERNPLRAKEPDRCRRRVVSKPDLIRFVNAFHPAERLVPQLMYVSVLRLSDALVLRIKDLNFADEQTEIARTKHGHCWIVPFPKSIDEKVRRQVESGAVLHRADLQENPNDVPVPHAYARKCPSVPRDFVGCGYFPASH
jgi:integrase